MKAKNLSISNQIFLTIVCFNFMVADSNGSHLTNKLRYEN